MHVFLLVNFFWLVKGNDFWACSLFFLRTFFLCIMFPNERRHTKHETVTIMKKKTWKKVKPLLFQKMVGVH